MIVTLYVGTIAGCGSPPEVARVTGSVTLNGDPLPEAIIVFRPMARATGQSTEGKVLDGKFDVRQKSGVFGRHRVEIYAHRSVAQREPATQEPLPPGQQPPAGGIQMLPDQFNRFSNLTFDILPGENRADFELVSQLR